MKRGAWKQASLATLRRSYLRLICNVDCNIDPKEQDGGI